MTIVPFPLAVCLGLATSGAVAQSPADFDHQVARAVTHMAGARTKRLSVFEWMKERIEIDAVRQSVLPTALPEAASVAVFTARIRVSQSRKVNEAQVRADDLPMDFVIKRYDVDLRFVPDPTYGQWAFQGGRYWVLDGDGRRSSELTMFPNLLTDAPSDVPHELAWTIMAP